MSTETRSRKSPRKGAALTLHDLAREIGVSKSTVANALSGQGRMSEDTRQRILSVVQKRDYQLNTYARTLRQGFNDRLIGMLAFSPDLGTGAMRVQKIRRLLAQRGYIVPIFTCGDSSVVFEEQSSVVASVCGQLPRAIICTTVHVDDDSVAHLRRYQEKGGLVVAYGHVPLTVGDQVIFDYGDGIYQAARHLLALGHRKLGLYCCDPRHSGRLWLKGFRRAIEEAGLTTPDEWIFEGPPYEEGGAKLARDFLRLEHRPTGLCIVNDVTSTTFINEVMRAGLRVPGDIGIVSQDDTPAARYGIVPITTVAQPVDRIAEAIVDLLCSRLDGQYEGPSRQIVLRGELVVRESAAAPGVA